MSGLNHQQYIEQILTSVGDSDALHATLASIAKVIDADKFLFIYRNKVPSPASSHVIHCESISENDIQHHEEHFAHEDLWCLHQKANPTNRFSNALGHIPYREYVNSAIYQDFFRHRGIHDTASAFIANGKDAGYIASFCRGKSQHIFDNTHNEFLNQLTPYFSHYVALQQRLEQHQLNISRFQSLFDHIDDRILVVCDSMRILHMNQSAEQWLQSSRSVSDRFGKLSLKVSHDSEQLRHTVRKTCSHMTESESAFSQLGFRDINGDIFTIYVSPITAAQLSIPNQPNSTVALLRVPKPKARNTSPVLWRQLYGLSQQEAAIAEMLCQAMSIEDVAKSRNTKITTARNQVKSILRKTQCSSQLELVVTLLNLK